MMVAVPWFRHSPMLDIAPLAYGCKTVLVHGLDRAIAFTTATLTRNQGGLVNVGERMSPFTVLMALKP